LVVLRCGLKLSQMIAVTGHRNPSVCRTCGDGVEIFAKRCETQ
jgi:hypothetical protein